MELFCEISYLIDDIGVVFDQKYNFRSERYMNKVSLNEEVKSEAFLQSQNNK